MIRSRHESNGRGRRAQPPATLMSLRRDVPGRARGETLSGECGSKQAIRERLWSLLTERRVARFPGAAGRIPNFIGAEAAARRLADSPAWRAARVVKCNP